MPELESNKESIEHQLNQARLDFNYQQQQVTQVEAKKGSVLAQIISLGRSVERLHQQRAQWTDKQAEIESRDNPKAKEIETCDNLIKYCNKLKIQLGLVEPSSEEVAKKTETEMINQFNKTDLDSKIKDGKILAVFYCHSYAPWYHTNRACTHGSKSTF
mgnify:CR=1 FL=1